MCLLCAKHVTIATQIFFTRMLEGALLATFSRKETDVHETQVSLPGLHSPWLEPKSSGYRVHRLNHSPHCLAKMFETLW